MCRVEDRIEVREALERSKNVKPLRSAPAKRQEKSSAKVPNDPNHIRSVYFSSDGKTIRTLDHNKHIALWDRATLRLLRRIKLPDSFTVLSVRAPDGKYLIGRETKDGRTVIQIRDTDTTRVLATLPLPRPDDSYSFFWFSDDLVLCLSEHKLYRFDYCKAAFRGKPQKIEDHPYGGEVAEDGKAIFWLQGSESRLLFGPLPGPVDRQNAHAPKRPRARHLRRQGRPGSGRQVFLRGRS